jgi:hypothetical protein
VEAPIVLPSIKPSKVASTLANVEPLLQPGERVLGLTRLVNFKPFVDVLVVTNARILAVATLRGPATAPVDLPAHVAATLRVEGGRLALPLVWKRKPLVLKLADKNDAALNALLASLSAGTSDATGTAPSTDEPERRSELPSASPGRPDARDWPDSVVVARPRLGRRVSAKASRRIEEMCHDHTDPWLILVSFGGAGVLAAWEDRLAIIKTGALTSLLAGSIGGEKAETFPFATIDALKYESDSLKGVLTVVTASHPAGSNVELPAGERRSEESEGADPFTRSHQLPLSKAEYEHALTQINELRARIASVRATASAQRTGRIDAAA